MQFDASFGWQQGTVYASAAIHYALVLQVILGLPIIILVIYASGNMGWWTNKETAVSWASELRFPNPQTYTYHRI